MENKTPADHVLELKYNPDVRTVFYAQSLCAKTALARHLALEHPHGLFLDSDVTAGGSAKAKIEAFLELSGVRAGQEKAQRWRSPSRLQLADVRTFS